MENDNTVLLNPPLFALDKDAPLRYAGRWGTAPARVQGRDTPMERQGHSDIHPYTGSYPSSGNNHLQTLFRRMSLVKSGGNLGTA